MKIKKNGIHKIHQTMDKSSYDVKIYFFCEF